MAESIEGAIPVADEQPDNLKGTATSKPNNNLEEYPTIVDEQMPLEVNEQLENAPSIEGNESGSDVAEHTDEHPITFASPMTFVSPMLPMKFNKVRVVKPDAKAVSSLDSAKSASTGSSEKKKLTEPGSSSKSSTVKDSPPIELPYREPPWSAIPEQSYGLEAIKNGVPKGTFELTGKAFFTFGRLDECDVTIEHPSSSRYHAVIQYCNEDSASRKKGFYLYDVGSSHGTYLNKEKVSSRVYCRLRVGYVIKFGGSSRLWIMQGPDEDQEEEIDMAAIRKKQEENRLAVAREVAEKQRAASINQPRAPPACADGEQDEGVSWGMREDAVDEQLNLADLLARKKNTEVKDAKRAVKNFYESEGQGEPEYACEEKQSGRAGLTHIAKLRLPIETATSDEIVAEGSGPNKKEAILACATDACRLIHAYDDILKLSREDQNVKRRRELEANDFYDSDDDSFLDRTGAVEKKRLNRMKHAGKKTGPDEVMTHTALKEKLFNMENEILALKEQIRVSDEAASGANEDGDDSLDAYMSSMSGVLDKKQKNAIKAQIIKLNKEAVRVSKLVEKTKPALPAVQNSSSRKNNLPVEPKLPTKQLKDQVTQEDEKAAVKKSSPNHQINTSESGTNSTCTNNTSTNEDNTSKHEDNTNEDDTITIEDETSTNEDITSKNEDITSKHEVDTSTNEVDTSTNEDDTSTNENNTSTNEDITSTNKDNTNNGCTADSSSNGSSAKEEKSLKSKHPLSSDEKSNSPPKKKRVHGPTISDNTSLVAQSVVDPEDSVGDKSVETNLSTTDPKYSTWVPPTGQTGDGKTYLNAKYGY